jgi:hypothetical protein
VFDAFASLGELGRVELAARHEIGVGRDDCIDLGAALQ